MRVSHGGALTSFRTRSPTDTLRGVGLRNRLHQREGTRVRELPLRTGRGEGRVRKLSLRDGHVNARVRNLSVRERRMREGDEIVEAYPLRAHTCSPRRKKERRR